jgi:hypothetical protein
MKRPMSIRPLFVFCVAIVLAASVYGQADARQLEPSYEVSLQMIVGSNESSGRQEMPASLSGISNHLKSSFAYKNYRLAGTIVGRVANSGSFEYKSTVSMFAEPRTPHPTFVEWTLGTMRSGPATGGKVGIQAQAFRFGARVPMVVPRVGEGVNTSPIVNYEPIGMALREVGLQINSPTLIGTINLPGAEGTVFLVMTVRSAEL